MRKMFISHEFVAKREAIKLKELLSQAVHSSSGKTEFFLTSDWYSLESGAPWFSPLVEKLREATCLVTIITRPEALALEYASNNIRFNKVSPAVVDTPMHARGSIRQRLLEPFAFNPRPLGPKEHN